MSTPIAPQEVYLPPPALSILALVFLLAATLYLLQPPSSSSASIYASGPFRYPIVGNTFQVPATKVWLYFEELGKKYGDLVRLSLGGDEILVLQNAKDAEELLNRRSHNYSSRKPLVYAGKYQSKNKRLVLLPYGEELKKQRAAFHHMLQPRVVGAYENMQEFESTKMLYDTLARPAEFEMNMKRYSASLVFKLAYGKRIDDDDKDLLAVLDILDGFIKDCYPGAHLVDSFPILDKLPDVLAPWRKHALRKHEREMELYGRLALDVLQRIEENREHPPDCFASRLWETQKDLELDLTSLSYVAGSAFEAGTDTTAATMLWFVMAMVLYPDELKTAQKEVDSLLGSDGSVMPTFHHLNDLPYCVALTKEVFRWMPAAPGAFPHYSDSEDTYKGFKIRANTMVIPNIWAMHRNEDDFPDAAEFQPKRFLQDAIKTSSIAACLAEGHYSFGFGRRSCPGKYLATKTIWIGVTRLLWAFDISRTLDSKGHPSPITPLNCTSGITCKPESFAASFNVRSKTHAETIQREWAVISHAI